MQLNIAVVKNEALSRVQNNIFNEDLVVDPSWFYGQPNNYDSVLIKFSLKPRTIENKFFKIQLKLKRYYADNFLNRDYVNNSIIRH